MGNDLAPGKSNPTAAPPAAASDVEIRLRLIEEKNTRLESENRQIVDRLRSAPAPVEPPAEPDPMDRFAEGLGLPDKTRDLLDESVRSRADAAADRAGKQAFDASARNMYLTEQRIAFRMTMDANPDMKSDSEGVAAANGVLQLKLAKSGERLDPTTYYGRLAEEYHTLKPRPAPVPVPLESGSNPSLAAPLGRPGEPAEPVQNAYEEDYGFEPGEIKDFRETGGRQATTDAMSERYHMGKNAGLSKEGFVSNLIQVNGPIRAEKTRVAKEARAAAK